MVKLPPLAPFCLDRDDRSFCVVSDVDAIGGDVNLSYEHVSEIIRRAMLHDALVNALDTAINHIEHMATHIVSQRTGYSFEALGEDAPGIKAALKVAKADQAPERMAGGGDPATSELLKPRGNEGIVSAEICFNALLLTGEAVADFAAVETWTQDQLDTAYDWAIRLHLQASDNDDVLVPARPEHVTVREVT